jgi:ABC-2 type transport system permease protein
MKLLRKIWAFYKRDFQIRLTYRFGFLSEIIRTAALFVSFFFIGKLVTGAGPHPALAAYGGDYFRFVLLGVILSTFMHAALSGATQTIGFERGQGTLEAVLLTPTPLAVLLIGKTLWELTQVTLKAAAYLLLGILLLGVRLPEANWTAASAVVLLTVAIFLGLGLISAGFFLVTREGSPIEVILGWSSQFLAGVYFPVAILPGWLKEVSAWMPFTYSLEAARKTLLGGIPAEGIARELAVLLAFSLVILPAGLGFFRWAFRKARLQGTLGFN